MLGGRRLRNKKKATLLLNPPLDSKRDIFAIEAPPRRACWVFYFYLVKGEGCARPKDACYRRDARRVKGEYLDADVYAEKLSTEEWRVC